MDLGLEDATAVLVGKRRNVFSTTCVTGGVAIPPTCRAPADLAPTVDGRSDFT